MTFKPTIFYIKQHSITGLKYFGKTTNINATNGRYRGGGVYWTKHIRKHGIKFVETIWKSEVFTDKEECIKFGLKFSEENNIVISQIWANLEIENGINGFVPGGKSALKGRFLTEEHKANISKSIKGREAPNKGKPSPLKGRLSPLKGRTDRSHKGKPSPKIGCINLAASIANKGIPKNKVKCPHCDKTGGVNNMYRYHFDNCKTNNIKE
jgi:hypothetical protein